MLFVQLQINHSSLPKELNFILVLRTRTKFDVRTSNRHVVSTITDKSRVITERTSNLSESEGRGRVFG